MCIIFAAYESHPHYRLILAANRDEFYKRPTEMAHFWKDEPTILAGRDLEQMGTWMGVTKNGRFAALTNYREPDKAAENKKSRGQIVRDFLAGYETPKKFLYTIQKEKDIYPGFNILVGDQQSFYYYSNVANEISELQVGIYGLSNHLLNTAWPKVTKGKEKLDKILSEQSDIEKEDLFRLLSDERKAPRDRLPQTGVSSEWEEILSSIFISSPEYGTRCSTVLTIDKAGFVDFTERTFVSKEQSERHFNFIINESNH